MDTWSTFCVSILGFFPLFKSKPIARTKTFKTSDSRLKLQPVEAFAWAPLFDSCSLFFPPPLCFLFFLTLFLLIFCIPSKITATNFTGFSHSFLSWVLSPLSRSTCIMKSAYSGKQKILFGGKAAQGLDIGSHWLQPPEWAHKFSLDVKLSSWFSAHQPRFNITEHQMLSFLC